MASLLSSALWRSALPNGPPSQLGCRSSRSRAQQWHLMQKNLGFFTTPHSRDAPCLRLSRFKVWAQESSPLNSSTSIEGFSSEAGERGSSTLNSSTSIEGFSSEAGERGTSNKSGQVENQNLLLKLLILAIIIAALSTIFSAVQFQSSNILLGTRPAEFGGPHYKLRLLGKEMLIGERCPGWIYFWLLMAAGFGLFVSEEALNVWVGATLARTLTFNGWIDLVTSVSANGLYIFSTVFWVYWGVCISDMIPFYAGRFAAQTKAGDTLRRKVGVSEKKLNRITQTVQRYGNLIGFVERFSLGVRNPTAFVAGAVGVSPDKFFTGVCLGALITMPLQMGVGFVLRDRPMTALAGVAAAVGTWTVLPYVAAGVASIIFIIRNGVAQQHSSTSTFSKDSK